jgi:methionine-gamma-lyase
LRDQSNQPRYRGTKTAAVHAGQDRNPFTRASAPDITMSTNFIIDPEVSFSADAITDETPFVYTRWANPTVTQLERKLAVLEGTEDCVAFASGMAGIVTLFLHLLRTGDHLLMSDVTYAAASELANHELQKLNIEVTRVDTSDPENVREALRPNTRLVYLESPANPLLRLTDIQVVADIAHQAGASVAVDSTFATPIGLRPMEL